MITATNFSTRLDQIFKSLDQSSVESDTIKVNLYTSAFLDVKNKLLSKVSDDQFVSEFSSLPQGQTPQEVLEFSKKFEDKIQSIGFNFEEEFNQSCKSVLEDFIKELQLNLPPEKVEELNKIIS